MSSPLLVAESVTVRRGPRLILDAVSASVHTGDRIGVVGRNGSGKSTLLRTLAGVVAPDSGRVARSGDTTTGLVAQGDRIGGRTVREALVGDAPPHEWAAQPAVRDVMTGLLGDVQGSFYRSGLDTEVAGLSGGELRRLNLAAALIGRPDVLLLDEPTNHLDLAAVTWLAQHLAAWPRGRRALVLVTHDRWLLDQVTERTWEVVGGGIDSYEGGYAAYVLAKAERERRAAASAARRRNLLRKELAWLQRGAPARTSKPRYRKEAAEALIADEPPPRDSLDLQRVATARLGRTVIDLEGVTLRPAPGVDPVLTDQTFLLGPGDRVGLLGANGAGKTTFLRLLSGGEDCPPTDGFVRRGKTVVTAVLGQHLSDADPDDRVLPWLRRGGEQVVVTSGRELTATQLLEMFGFTGDASHKRLGDLSGGERRRLELLRILLAGPNLLMLDEPTNDLDIETLTVLEDLLDTWPGSLVVVSHDRYFLERVCDDIWALAGDGSLRHLPGGVTDYLALPEVPPPATIGEPGRRSSAADERQARKALARIERQLERVARDREALHRELAAAATEPDQLMTLGRDLAAVEQRETQLEEEWLSAAESLE